MSVERLLNWFFEVHEIGRRGLPRYLTRWVLWGRRGRDGSRRNGPGGKVFLHWFHRGNAEPYPHNHPWPFWSLILLGGYYEWTLTGYVNPETGERQQERRWYGPLSLLRRPAQWAHRVELPAGRRCWTLVWTAAKVRSWEFLCPQGWTNWRVHEANQAAGKPGCGD